MTLDRIAQNSVRSVAGSGAGAPKRVSVDEGRKRVLAIVAGILVARHIKTADDLFDCKATPRTESLIAAAVQWSERIMRKIDNAFPGK